MPYIKYSEQEELHNGKSPTTAGELNYSFTMIALEYLKTVGERYQSYNDIIGALEGAKLEIYRRKVSAY